MVEESAAIIDPPKPHLISVNFFTKRGNKDELIINADEVTSPIDSKSRWFSYSFVRPVFLTKIEILTDGFATYDRFEIVVDHVDGTQHEERVAVENELVVLRLGKLSTGFRFKPDSRYLSKPKLLQINVTGYSEEEFHSFELNVKEYHSKLTELRKREDALEAQSDKITEYALKKTELESEIGIAKAESEQLSKQLILVAVKVSHENERLKDAVAKAAIEEEKQRNVSAAVERETTKLQELVREVRLFPTEISGFIKEGNRSIKWYLAIGFPFLTILIMIVWRLFSNAVDLTQIYRTEEDIEIWTIFLTRVPFIIVAVALVEACGYVVGRLVFEIMRINRQRLEFAKLSIIAKDVSTASANGLEGITEEALFDHETKLKMELLREHMKNYVGKEFEYQGSGLIAAINGVANRLTKEKSD